MSAASVEAAIKAQTDQIGALKGAFAGAVAARGPNPLWDLAWGADDVPYNNRVLNGQLSGVDAAINAVTVGSSLFAPWFNLHNTYFATDAGLVAGGVPIATLKAAVEDYYRWRVGQYFAQAMNEAIGQVIAPKNVFPRPDLILGTFAATGPAAGTFTPGAAVDTARSGPGTIGVYTTVVIGGADLALALTCRFEDGTTAAVAATVPAGSAIGTRVLAGRQAITAYNGGTGVVGVAATGAFKVGQKVLIADAGVSEVADVIALAPNASLTLGKVGSGAGGLRNAYTTGGFVYPQYTQVTAATVTGGTAGDTVQFRPEPDRAQMIG